MVHQLLPLLTFTLLLLLILGGNALAAPGNDLPGQEDVAVEPRADDSIDGTLKCGSFATGSKRQALGLVADLRNGGKIADRTWHVKAGTCNRVHCWDTTGIYICNDSSRDLTIEGHDIGDAAQHVYNNCCRTDYTNNRFNAGISGQKFVRNHAVDYNVVLAYADCKGSFNIRPYEAGGQGVNGKCVGGDINPYWDGNL